MRHGRVHQSPFVLAGALLGLLVASCGTTSGSSAPSRGAVLFERHCTVCHGERGDANTAVRSLLFPRARAFRDGVFKLVRTQNGVPTDEDLLGVLRRGLPGSAMPAYEWLPDDDLQALARHVRSLAVDGMVETLQLRIASLGMTATSDEVRAEAVRRLEPGPAVAVPDFARSAGGASPAGALLYQRHCAACHGDDGKGREPDPDWAGVADVVWPRDFTRGFLRGDASRESLAYRIRAGMPGSGMPPSDLGDAECALLVDHVRSLLADGTDAHHVQWRRRLRARRVPETPVDGEDLTWTDTEGVRLPLAPLWWRDAAVFEVEVRAVHDGERLAILLQWNDATRDDRATGESPQGDGGAVEWTAAAEPPMFAMGGSEGVEIWHWKAFRREETAGALDLLQRLSLDGTDASPMLPGLTAPMRRGEALAVHGPKGMQSERGLGRAIAAVPRWQDGRWSLMLSRSLRALRADEIELSAGSSLLVAFAVWNGSVDAHAASKSVSTWHAITLDR